MRNRGRTRVSRATFLPILLAAGAAAGCGDSEPDDQPEPRLTLAEVARADVPSNNRGALLFDADEIPIRIAASRDGTRAFLATERITESGRTTEIHTFDMSGEPRPTGLYVPFDDRSAQLRNADGQSVALAAIGDPAIVRGVRDIE